MKSQVPYPDRAIFLHDDKITASIKEQLTTHLFDHVEYHPFVGSLIFKKGALHPSKGFPFPEAVWAANQAKVVITEAMKLIYKPVFILGFMLTWNKIKFIEDVLESYNRIAMRALKPYLLKDIYLIPTSRSINNIVLVFLTKLGINQNIASDFAYVVAHLIEYDDAYRYLIQDIMSETSSWALMYKPREELERISDIFRSRHDNPVVVPKFNRIIKILLLALYVPSIKKAFVEAVERRIEGMQYDEADWYWVSQRGDYRYGGMEYEERVSKLTQLPVQVTVNI